jgi:hypothetical protein
VTFFENFRKALNRDLRIGTTCSVVEAFEQFVAVLLLEQHDYLARSAIKFPCDKHVDWIMWRFKPTVTKQISLAPVLID